MCRLARNPGAPPVTKITEKMAEHETGDGFTLVTNSHYSAFAMAEKMALAGYSVQLSGIKGGDWTVVVTECERAKELSHALTSKASA